MCECVHICVCMSVSVHMCVCMCYICEHRGQRRSSGVLLSRSLPSCLESGSLMELQLGWQPASPSNPVSAPHHHEVTGSLRPSPVLLHGYWGFKPGSLPLCSKPPFPLSHRPVPDFPFKADTSTFQEPFLFSAPSFRGLVLASGRKHLFLSSPASNNINLLKPFFLFFSVPVSPQGHFCLCHFGSSHAES